MTLRGIFFEKSTMESLYGDADIISSEIESMIGRYDVLVRQMATNRDFRMIASETLRGRPSANTLSMGGS